MASIGSMRHFIDLIHPQVTTDKAGFATAHDQVVASVRAYMEIRHASAAWVNRAAYTKADVLFRIRALPGLQVTTDMEITSPEGRFVIDAVEYVGRYVEILAHKVEPEGTTKKGQV
ncbi:MAG: head-tail adaptor protein [Actinomycetaceae bacterium]|nr:head-tail adaptor protein [Actinomycetaceae bacterium]